MRAETNPPETAMLPPLRRDEEGVIRFEENHIVSMIFRDAISMNEIMRRGQWRRCDLETLWAMSGYSVKGFCELSFVRECTAERVDDMYAAFVEAERAAVEAEIAAAQKRIGTVEVKVTECEPLIEWCEQVREIIEHIAKESNVPINLAALKFPPIPPVRKPRP